MMAPEHKSLGGGRICPPPFKVGLRLALAFGKLHEIDSGLIFIPTLIKCVWNNEMM